MVVDRLTGKDEWDVWFSSVQREKDRNEGTTSYVIICSRAPEVFPAYSARTSAAFPDDVALSSAYLPDSKTSFSVFYGCSPDQMADIETSLRSTGGIVDHPLLCMGILGELERKRLVDLAEDLIDKFTVDSDFLENKHWDLNTVKMRESLAICLRSRTLLDQIRSFKRQLNKVLKEFDRLRQEESQSADMFETGLIIQQRIHDVLDEYDDKIDECSMMAENLSLAMQTGWSQISREDSIVNTRIAKANTTIALESQIENAQMRSIAVLGMIYLPLSCVGSIFSTTIFNWRPVEGEPVISNYIWILVVISAGLTALTILAWHLTTSREKIKQNKRSKSFDIELDRIA
ncbi:phenylalanine--tRNA ligase alpha subunit [Rhypophila decipiens]